MRLIPVLPIFLLTACITVTTPLSAELPMTPTPPKPVWTNVCVEDWYAKAALPPCVESWIADLTAQQKKIEKKQKVKKYD